MKKVNLGCNPQYRRRGPESHDGVLPLLFLAYPSQKKFVALRTAFELYDASV